MRKLLRYILIFLLGLLIGIGGFEVLNQKNSDFTYEIKVEEINNSSEKNMTKLGTISGVEYYIYNLKDIYFLKNGNRQTLLLTLEDEKITIKELLNEMTLSDNCGGFIYSYDGNGNLGKDKFSVLKGENKYVFTTYNPLLSDSIYDEFCNLT